MRHAVSPETGVVSGTSGGPRGNTGGTTQGIRRSLFDQIRAAPALTRQAREVFECLHRRIGPGRTAELYLSELVKVEKVCNQNDVRPCLEELRDAGLIAVTFGQRMWSAERRCTLFAPSIIEVRPLDSQHVDLKRLLDPATKPAPIRRRAVRLAGKKAQAAGDVGDSRNSSNNKGLHSEDRNSQTLNPNEAVTHISDITSRADITNVRLLSGYPQENKNSITDKLASLNNSQKVYIEGPGGLALIDIPGIEALVGWKIVAAHQGFPVVRSDDIRGERPEIQRMSHVQALEALSENASLEEVLDAGGADEQQKWRRAAQARGATTERLVVAWVRFALDRYRRNSLLEQYPVVFTARVLEGLEGALVDSGADPLTGKRTKPLGRWRWDLGHRASCVDLLMADESLNRLISAQHKLASASVDEIRSKLMSDNELMLSAIQNRKKNQQ